jgi:hypothetical protein
MNPSRLERAVAPLFLVGRRIMPRSIAFADRGTDMNFAEQFAKNHGHSLIVDGQEVVPIIRRSVLPGCRVRVIWRSARSLPVQGIRIKLKGGKLKLLSAGGADLNDIVLWRDTAPDEVAYLLAAKKPAELLIWNCWRDERGTMQAWIGNAAMRVVESGPNSVSVACNSRHEITFADLVFDVIFNAP